MADILPPETQTRTVGVVVERRKLNSPWAEYGWRVAQILPGTPASEPWTKLAVGEGWEQFYAGPAELVLFRRETISYKYNLESSQPQVFVVLRQCNDERGIMLHLATVCAGEAHAYAESMQDTVESVPMPEAIEQWVAEYVGEHHVEQKFYKRQRTKVDPESLARKNHLYASDPFRQVLEDE